MALETSDTPDVAVEPVNTGAAYQITNVNDPRIRAQLDQLNRPRKETQPIVADEEVRVVLESLDLQ